MDDEGLYIVTGASSGMGIELAAGLHAAGHHIVMACRNLAKAEPIRQRIASTTGGTVELLPLDLSLPESVEQFTQTLLRRNVAVTALLNNAGSMTGNYRLTPWGAEQNSAVNYFGTVALTLGLLPAMRRGSRIIQTLSYTRHIGRLHEGWMCPTRHGFSRFGTYSASKCALLLFSAALRQALASSGIRVYAADPGVVSTGIMHFGQWFDPLVDKLFRPLIKTPAEGAATALALALGRLPHLDDDTLYWMGERPRPRAARRATTHRYLDSLRAETSRITTQAWPTAATVAVPTHQTITQ